MRVGEGQYIYEWIDNWVTLPDTELGRKDKAHHGIVVTESGLVLMFHEGGPAILAYDTDGNLQGEWESGLTNAHGMTLVQEDGTEYLLMADNKSGQVVKTTLHGEVVLNIECPEIPIYREGRYAPTWAAASEERYGGNGDIWVADGYGESYVHRYDKHGKYITSITGEEGNIGRFDQPHGIWIGNRRNELELYISDRVNGRVQVYDTDGNYKRVFGSEFFNKRSPSGFLSLGELMLVLELRSRLSLVDSDDDLVCYIGDNSPVINADNWPDVAESLIKKGRFNSPHSAAVDCDGNIYVAEFITGGRITKLAKS